MKKNKIRVGAVNYLNTKPLIYGFSKGEMKDEIELVLDYPSRIAEMLLQDKIDIGLVPVAIIPELKEHFIVSDYCIACDGAVTSVCLFSQVPLEEIENILLDYQSRTSNLLLKILIEKFWRITPQLKETSNEYLEEIVGSTAGLLIGDRALDQRNRFKYSYDLGEEWKRFTGLPFVFAVWVANKKINKDFLQKFNKTNNMGLIQLDDVIKGQIDQSFDLKKYYNSHIQYDLDAEALKGLDLFLALRNGINKN